MEHFLLAYEFLEFSLEQPHAIKNNPKIIVSSKNPLITEIANKKSIIACMFVVFWSAILLRL